MFSCIARGEAEGFSLGEQRDKRRPTDRLPGFDHSSLCEDFLLVLDSQQFGSICLLLYRSSKFVTFQAVLSASVSTPEIPITCGLLQPRLPSECVRLLSPYFPSSSSVSK